MACGPPALDPAPTAGQVDIDRRAGTGRQHPTAVSGTDFTYHTKDQLVVGIAEATGLRLRKIRKAMAASEPYPVG
jgi:hypothetical protein